MSMPLIKASRTKRNQAVTDLIESVALEECALSHILNAEGETLQKVLCFRDLSTEDIIKTNHSVTGVIKEVADVEKQLQEKLELFKRCLCRPLDDDDDNDNDDDDDDDDDNCDKRRR